MGGQGYDLYGLSLPVMKKLCLFATLAVSCLAFSLGAATATKPAPSAGYVGSSKSDVYHYRSCSAAKKILSSNLVTFASKDEATKRGYRACKVCKP